MRFVIGKDILPHEYKNAVFNRESASRLRVIGKISTWIFIIFIARTLQLGFQSNDYRKSNTQKAQIESRADIVDRNGIVLAKSVRSRHIKLYPGVKPQDMDAIANIIHKIAPKDYSVQDALDLIKSSKRWVYIKKNASEDDMKLVLAENKNYKCENKNNNCFDIEYFTQRRYPQRNVFAHVVGFAGKDGGSAGVEYTYDKYLRENKDPLRLSIDSRVQNIFHEQLTIAMNKYSAKGAMGMLMNSSTGEMIAMVQLPDFDPNNVNAATKEILRFKLLRANFEMGSIFKIFNTALAFENKLENNIYDVSKPLPIKDKYNRIVHRVKDIDTFYRDIKQGKKKSKMKAPEIMLYSCNTGSAQIALDLPENAQKDFFERLNFDKPLRLDFGKTETGLTHKFWGPVEKATAAFGHGVTVTPMHLLLGVNAMTNGGIYIYPTLIKRNIGAVRGERILDSEISAKLRDIMFHIAEETTAKKARVKGIEVGGKTGTAERRHKDGTTDKTRNTTVFTGVFPVSAPQYIIIIMLEEPQGTKETGGWKTAAQNAVPTAGAILDGIMPLLFE